MKQHKKHKHWKAMKTLKRENNFRELFIGRRTEFLGLTKPETISDYFGVPIDDVLRWKEPKYEKAWLEIQKVRSSLRKERVIAVVCKEMPKGTVLTDNVGHWGKRRLSQNQWVYFSCADLETAHSVRAFLDRIAKGIIRSAEDITEIAETEVEKEPIIETLETKEELVEVRKR